MVLVGDTVALKGRTVIDTPKFGSLEAVESAKARQRFAGLPRIRQFSTRIQ